MLSLKKGWPPFVIVVFLLFIVLSPAPARADIAPPGLPPGANPSPEEEGTQVQMVTETVLVAVLPNAPAESLGQARVTADFIMHNWGENTESLAVRFPLSANYFHDYPDTEITDFEVRIGGQLLSTRRVEIPDQIDDLRPWAEFEVEFPAGQDVSIQVIYALEGMGEYPYISFKYVLETGAGWKDSIGSGDIIVRLPYEANPYNVILDEQIGWSQTTPGGAFAGNEVRWHFENLEPTRADNFEVSLVMPSAWQKVLIERDNASRNPQDGEAWGRLGKIYKEISWLRRWLRSDAGGQELYVLSAQAYEQAIALLPDDALWHAGYADLLMKHLFTLNGMAYPFDLHGQEELGELLRALELLDRSMALSPGNSVAVDLLTELTYAYPEAVQLDGENFVILYLTATPIIEPTATATPLPTETPTALPPDTPTTNPTATSLLADTPAPDVTSIPTSTPTPPNASPGVTFCGVALLILIPALRRKKK